MQKEKIIKNNIIQSIKKIIAFGAIIFVVIFACLITIKNVFSYSLIEKNLSDILGLKIELINPKTTFDFKFNINTKAKYINIYNENKSIKFAEIENPDITFKPIGFIFNKINFKKLNAKNIKLNIKRDSKGKIDIIEASKIKDLKIFEKQKFKLTKLNTQIDNIKINFKDEYKIKSEISFNLTNTDINISKKDKSLYIYQTGTIDTYTNSKKQTANLYFCAKSNYPLNNFNADNLSLNVSIKDINLYIFKDLAKKYISKDIISFEGNSNITIKTDEENLIQKLTLTINNPTLKLTNNKIISPFKKDIIVKSDFIPGKDKIEIKKLSVNSNKLLINSNGIITKPFSKKRNLDFKINISNTELNNLIYFLPDNLIYYRPKGIPTLKKSNFYGVINGDINLKLFPLDITGNLKVSNVHIPNYPKPYIENDVNLFFMKDKMRVYTRVYTPENEYVIIDGISNLDDSLYGKYSVKSTSKIDLSFAKLYLVPIQQIIGFNIGPVPIMDISGYGNIDIKTQGTIKDAQIFGEFQAYNASAKIEGLDAKLTKGDCKLIFDNKNLIFKKIHGKMDEADFTLTGIGDTKGNVDLKAKIKNARTHNILKIFNNSTITKPYTKLTKDIIASSGQTDANINLKGTIEDWENKDFLSQLYLSGNINFKNNKIILKNKFSAQKINGLLTFGQKQKGVFELYINNSKININFSSNHPLEKIAKGEEFNFESLIYSNKFSFLDILKEVTKNNKYAPILSNLQKIDFYTKFNIKTQGKISLKNINIEKLKNYGFIIGLNDSTKPNIKFNSGLIKINGDKLIFEKFNASILEGNIKASGYIQNFLSKNPNSDATIILNNLNLTGLNQFLPKTNISSGRLKSGRILLKKDAIKLSSISINYDNMPLFINAYLKDIYKTKNLDASFSTILNEKSTDSLINPYLTYPIKVKGEIPTKGHFRGKADNYTIDLTATIPKNSDISFSGANLGDTNHKREITGKIDVKDNRANINNLRLVKYIANQNGKINAINALKINGSIIQNKNTLNYDNLKITTLSPINVRILNLIFKKSLLKQGNFECDINLNGNIKLPQINGKVYLQDLDIPLYDTQINNIKVNIANKFIDAEFFAKNNQNDLKMSLRAQNKLTTPYAIENITIQSNKLNINEILSSITPTQNKTDINKKNEVLIKPSDIIIKNGNFDFKEVSFEKIKAQNLKGEFNYQDDIFNLKNSTLDIAEGKFTANGRYSLKTTKLNLNAKMEDCDSNILTKEFLNLSDQIFGKINGSVILSGKNLNTPEAIKNISSQVEFSINNGKMPKLGSLEYLLRAGNLIKNGILGLSLNNIIQVLTPYKTGDFEKITGMLIIKNAEIEKLEIMSKGKNLSMYLSGTYSIFENFADIKIYGKLSQNISNALGALGNASLKQFIDSISPKKNKKGINEDLQYNLDKIPSIEIENPEPRYFKVKVLGDINKENYIKNFSWI